MADFVSHVNKDGVVMPIAASLYGICETAANTAEKTVVCQNFDAFIPGMTIHIKFTYANEADEPTLNINSMGTRKIKRGDDSSSNDFFYWTAGSVVSFTYDSNDNKWYIDNYVHLDYSSDVAQANDKTIVNLTGGNRIVKSMFGQNNLYSEINNAKAKTAYPVNSYLYDGSTGNVARTTATVSSGSNLASGTNFEYVDSLGKEISKIKNNVYASLSAAYADLVGGTYSVSADWSKAEGAEFYIND